MKALPTEQVHTAVQFMLSALSHPDARISGDALEGVVSGKSLLRGILSGQLIVCTPAPPEPAKSAGPMDESSEEDAGDEGE